MQVAKVVLEKTVFRFDKPFDYLVDDSIKQKCLPGVRVTVPFGRGDATRLGLVLSLQDFAESPEKLKSIKTVEDDEPILSDEMLKMVVWLREHTFCTYYDAVRCLLPFGLHLKVHRFIEFNPNVAPSVLAELSEQENQLVSFVRHKKGPCDQNDLLETFGLVENAPVFKGLLQKQVLIQQEQALQNMQDPTAQMLRLGTESADRLTPKQNAVVELLEQVGTASVKEVLYYTGVTRAVVQTLLKKGRVEQFTVPTFKYQDYIQTEVENISLTDEQQSVFNKLQEKINQQVFSTALLYGVTGSGKTSVFLRLVDQTVAAGKSVIVMVPEIALTPQTLSKFRKRYGERVAVFHSAMSLGRRREEYRRVAEGKATVAIGTRSAVFAPVKNLGLIIMDEEHEHTYKSEQAPRFHARDVAKFRCRYHNALLLLGSATPSVESFTLAKAGRYELFELKNRYGNATLPTVQTVDMRKELSAGNAGVFSRELVENLTEVMKKKEQAIILLNRRGHNTYVSCPACSKVFTCPSCSISLTYHSANGRLMCHYCGESFPVPKKCPDCNNEKLRFSGAGTQRADEELKQLFPTARILRLDADTTLARDSFERGLSAFANGEYDFMLGTQMVAKGLDFPKVTLVGVLSADQSMYSDDYRSFERTFALLTQVIGRSGRGEKAGKALVQTSDPESELIALAAAQDYQGFYQTEIMTRKLMVYPPYCDLVQVGIVANQVAAVKDAATTVFNLLKEKLQESQTVKAIVLGPNPAGVVKAGGKYRYRIIVKTKNNTEFRSMMRKVLDAFYQNAEKTVTVFVDINPESIL